MNGAGGKEMANCFRFPLTKGTDRADGRGSFFGYLPPEVQNFVAKEMNTPVSVVTGVVTFYSYFHQ